MTGERTLDADPNLAVMLDPRCCCPGIASNELRTVATLRLMHHPATYQAKSRTQFPHFRFCKFGSHSEPFKFRVGCPEWCGALACASSGQVRIWLIHWGLVCILGVEHRSPKDFVSWPWKPTTNECLSSGRDEQIVYMCTKSRLLDPLALQLLAAQFFQKGNVSWTVPWAE